MEFLLIPAGVLFGFLLGLLPGMHINNVLPFFAFLPLADAGFYFFVISASISFVFSSFFQSVLLGIPNEDTVLSILPAHRMVLRGQAHTALRMLIDGGIAAFLLSPVFLIAYFFLAGNLQQSIHQAVPFALIGVLFYLLATDRKAAVIIVAFSSALGFLTFDFNLLLPLLSGFFALSTLLTSLETAEIPEQKIVKNEGKKITIPAAIACVLSFFLNFFPALSSSIIATIYSAFRKVEEKTFLAVIGSTNVAYMIFSFFIFSLIGKTRSGSAAFLAGVSKENIFFIAGIILVAGALAAVLSLLLAKRMVRIYQKISYRKLTVFSIAFLLLANAAFTGLFGLLVLFASTSIGLFCVRLGVRRINCMSALIVPTIWVLL